MKKAVLSAALGLGLVFAGTASASADQQLRCFVGGAGTCRISGDVVKLSAPGAGENYAGVYFASSRPQGKPLARVDFQFAYTGDIAGGSPRWSIPVDVDGNGSADGYAFIDAVNCGGVDGVAGKVGTMQENCLVYFGSDGYANWDAFASAHPDYRTAASSKPFVVADYDTAVTLRNVFFRIRAN